MNICLEIGVFRDELNLANVSPILKKKAKVNIRKTIRLLRFYPTCQAFLKESSTNISTYPTCQMFLKESSTNMSGIHNIESLNILSTLF